MSETLHSTWNEQKKENLTKTNNSSFLPAKKMKEREGESMVSVGNHPVGVKLDGAGTGTLGLPEDAADRRSPALLAKRSSGDAQVFSWELVSTDEHQSCQVTIPSLHPTHWERRAVMAIAQGMERLQDIWMESKDVCGYSVSFIHLTRLFFTENDAWGSNTLDGNSGSLSEASGEERGWPEAPPRPLCFSVRFSLTGVM